MKNIVITALAVLVCVTACFSPLDYKASEGKGSISITLSGGASPSPARAAVNEQELEYRIDFFGHEKAVPFSEIARWGDTVTVEVAVGVWRVSVTAYAPGYSDNTRAIGESTAIEVKKGEETPAAIKMAEYIEVGTWAQLRAEMQNGERDSFIKITNNISLTANDREVELNLPVDSPAKERTVTLAADTRSGANITFLNNTSNGLFSIGENVHLVIGYSSPAFPDCHGIVQLNGVRRPYIQVDPSASLTLNGAVLLVGGDSNINDWGFNVAVWNMGTLIMNGGKIAGNSADRKGGIDHSGDKFEISGDSYVENILLGAEKSITVTGSLTQEKTAVITLPGYYSDQIVILDDNDNGRTVSSEYKKFTISAPIFDPIDLWISSDGHLSGWNLEEFVIDIAALGHMNAVAADRFGYFYITDIEGGTDPWIYKIDPQGKVVQDWVDKANSYSFFAIDIAVSSGGDVYALGIALGQVIRICKISPDGTADQFWGGQVAEILQYPSSIAVDGAGNVFVLDIDAGTTPKSSLYKITPAGNLDTGWNSGIADYSYDPHCIAAGRDGSVYMAVRVSDAGDFGICKIPPSGEISVEWSIESDISAIAVDGDGNVYAGDNDLSQAKHIRIMRPGSDAAVMARGTTFPEDYFGDYRDGFDYIRSIASYIDGNGKHIVYAVDTASKILKLTEGAR